MKYTVHLTLLFSAFLFVTGCGERTPYNVVMVNGTVLVDGQPQAGIGVIFVPVDSNVGHGASGMTNAAGKFKLTTGGLGIDKGAEPGKYNVTFSKITVDTAGLTETEVRQKFGEGHIPFVYDLLPLRYKNPKTSCIEPVTVEKGGKNEFSFSISMEGYEAEYEKAVADQEEVQKQFDAPRPLRGGASLQ